jgi:hypothetical protein
MVDSMYFIAISFLDSNLRQSLLLSKNGFYTALAAFEQKIR